MEQVPISGLYYKPMTIINDDSRVINKLEASLTDNARVVIYDRHMFIVQATEYLKTLLDAVCQVGLRSRYLMKRW
jgi:hypothetical protein